MKFDFSKIKRNDDMKTISEDELEKIANEAQSRMQEWHGKKESGNLTEEEKKAIENTKKFMEYDGDPFTLSPEEFEKLFK